MDMQGWASQEVLIEKEFVSLIYKNGRKFLGNQDILLCVYMHLYFYK